MRTWVEQAPQRAPVREVPLPAPPSCALSVQSWDLGEFSKGAGLCWRGNSCRCATVRAAGELPVKRRRLHRAGGGLHRRLPVRARSLCSAASRTAPLAWTGTCLPPTVIAEDPTTESEEKMLSALIVFSMTKVVDKGRLFSPSHHDTLAPPGILTLPHTDCTHSPPNCHCLPLLATHLPPRRHTDTLTSILTDFHRKPKRVITLD